METHLCVPYKVKQKDKPQITLYFKVLLFIFLRVMCSGYFLPLQKHIKTKPWVKVTDSKPFIYTNTVELSWCRVKSWVLCYITDQQNCLLNSNWIQSISYWRQQEPWGSKPEVKSLHGCNSKYSSSSKPLLVKGYIWNKK